MADIALSWPRLTCPALAFDVGKRDDEGEDRARPQVFAIASESVDFRDHQDFYFRYGFPKNPGKLPIKSAPAAVTTGAAERHVTGLSMAA